MISLGEGSAGTLHIGRAQWEGQPGFVFQAFSASRGPAPYIDKVQRG